MCFAVPQPQLLLTLGPCSESCSLAGADPRTRAWHHRTPVGHAGNPIRDHDQQGLGDGAGGIVASGLSLVFIVEGLLSVPIEGSTTLFLAGTALHLFATTSMGIFLGTFARSMPQFGLLLMLVLLPLQVLSGGTTPRESMPEFVQFIMLAAPTTHFVMFAQAILYRGAGLSVVWPQFIALAVIGAAFFSYSLARFRKTIGTMA